MSPTRGRGRDLNRTWGRSSCICLRARGASKRVSRNERGVPTVLLFLVIARGFVTPTGYGMEGVSGRLCSSAKNASCAAACWSPSFCCGCQSVRKAQQFVPNPQRPLERNHRAIRATAVGGVVLRTFCTAIPFSIASDTRRRRGSPHPFAILIDFESTHGGETQ